MKTSSGAREGKERGERVPDKSPLHTLMACPLPDLDLPEWDYSEFQISLPGEVRGQGHHFLTHAAPSPCLHSKGVDVSWMKECVF